MKSELQHFLSQLRGIQAHTKTIAFMYGEESNTRADLLHIEERLARTLGELDYLVNLKIGTSNDDRPIHHHPV